MRIAIDASRTLVAERTGTERYSLELIRGLLQVDRANEYLLYFRRPPPAELIPTAANWRPRVVGPSRLWTHIGLGRALARERPDVLFVPAHVLPLLHRGRSVATVHDLGFRFYPRAHPPLARCYLELSSRLAAHRATRLIAVSHSTARDLQRLYRVPAERIRVVYEGVGPQFRPLRDRQMLAEVRRRYGLGREPYLLAVGTLQPRKNLVGLLRAYRRLLDVVDEPCQLVLAGRMGWGVRTIAGEAARLGLERHVRRLGHVPDEDLPALYGEALAFIQPSFYEGFGLTALEALACGTPVVAANASSLPEVVGSAALLVDPNSPADIATALGRLIAEPNLRAELAAAGPRRAARFSWKRCARETLAVLLEAGAACPA
jgi:glycosyltransferase involved in cell wall biosynthesis